MSQETEKIMKDFDKFLKLHINEITDKASSDRLVEQFLREQGIPSDLDWENAVPETAVDYMMLAEEAASEEQHVEYVRKALELEPENVDAQLQLIAYTMGDNPNKQVSALRELKENAAKQLEQEGDYFKEDIGMFWGIIETRPYMRVCYAYMDVLSKLGMSRMAIAEGQHMLELCKGDNLGVRYLLMHLYAFLEDEEHALALCKQFNSQNEALMLLPLAVLYYKLGQFDKAGDYINRLEKVNKDTKKFLRAGEKDELESLLKNVDGYRYTVGTIEELLADMVSSGFLFDSTPFFFQWANNFLCAQTAKKKTAAGKGSRKKK